MIPNARSIFLLAILPSLAFGQDSRPATQKSAEKGPKLLRARHILIPWKGSQARSAKPVEWSKEDAKKLAESLIKKLGEGAEFASLAKEHSVCPSKADGGYLGQFASGRMVPAFSKAVIGAKDGQVVGPIETPFGWHVIERMENKHPWPAKFALSHIVISFEGAQRRLGTVDRKRKDAKALAEKLITQLRAGKAEFGETAAKYSDDDASKGNGGSLGTREPSRLFPRMSDAVASLKVGDISEPVETPLGFHILRRDQIPPMLGAKHILISYQGSSAQGGAKLTKEEARAKATELVTKVKNGGDFAKLAAAHSSCPSKSRGGDLGTFERGRMVPAFEKALIAAKAGDVVGPVETEFGFHVIVRTK